MFSRCQGDEIWVLLLEKAYAKLHRNYWALRGGFVAHGMGDLTGCPTNFNKFPAERKSFYQITSYADDLWHNLIKGDNKGYIMCASTPGVDQFTESNGPNQETGIVAGHAYSVISCKEYDGIRLLKIRNPWGSFEWGGAWSDNAPEWTQEYIDYFQPDFNSNDGTFWMWYEDFFKNFESINVCKVADWKEVRLKGKFIRLWELEDTDEDWVLSKFYYSFRLEETAKIDICLHQEDIRIIGADKRRYKIIYKLKIANIPGYSDEEHNNMRK